MRLCDFARKNITLKLEQNILKTNNLSIGYISKKHQQIIASNITIDLKKGTLVCLLGKNGIGKSTLLRTISKVQPALSGSVEIDGKNLAQISTEALSKKIGLVLTERIPQSNLTVYELIALGRQPYTNWIGTLTEDDKTQIQKAISNTNIDELANKRCDELSDGQLQKVMIARVLAQNTDIIILDEPTAHLDIHHKIEVFNLLKTLVSQHQKTVIISTHEVQLAIQIANELWLMNEQNFTSGTTENLIAENQLNTLFNSELVKFDAKTKQFIINT